MQTLYRLYLLQIILTVAVMLFPQGIALWIARVLLALLMLFLWSVLNYARKLEEQGREKILGEKAAREIMHILKEMPPLDND